MLQKAMADLQKQPRIPIYFFGLQRERPVSPLAGALGIGPLPRPSGIEAGRYDRLAECATRLFQSVPADATALWIYAHEVSSRSEIEVQLARLPARRCRCVFFYSSDDAEPISLRDSNVSIFRTSLFASRRLAHEHAMPALCDDLLASAGRELTARMWSRVPSVGFCGFVGSPLKRFFFQALSRQEKSRGLFLRERALAALEHSADISVQLIRRRTFWGGSMSRFHFDAAQQERVRAEFVQNLLGTDYGLCARGKGNFSYRLYEVLSAGRIPLFVNSDCVLPFENRIRWKQHMVWLEQDEIATAADRVVRFHEELGPSGFQELQRQNRKLWEDWLSPEAFFWRALAELTPC